MGYPCALGMATPLALIRGGGIAAEKGILLRSGAAFQVLPKIDTIALDKTGTVTRGKPTVIKVLTHEKESEEGVLYMAACVELSSEHPLARAIIDFCKKRCYTIPDPNIVKSFDAIPGMGVKA